MASVLSVTSLGFVATLVLLKGGHIIHPFCPFPAPSGHPLRASLLQLLSQIFRFRPKSLTKIILGGIFIAHRKKSL